MTLTRPTSVQRKLPLDDAPPIVLADIADARRQLRGLDEDDILDLIYDGKLSWAWNIGLGEARYVRIYPECIEHYRRGGKPSPILTQDLVITTLLARHRDKPFLKSTTLALLLNCGSTHIINLIEAKELKLQPGTTYSRGPNGAALLTVDSFRRFLQTRRLP